MTEKTATVTILDRPIEVREYKDSQIMLLVSEANTIKRTGADPTRRMQGVDRVMRLLESAVVSEEDRDWLVEQNIAGNISMGDLTGFLRAFNSDDEETVVPNRAVRRGRPPKQR
jgi:hypothetical protein